MGVEVREGETPGVPLRRAALLAVFALSSAVAAVATIVPSTDAELLLAKAAVLEPVAISLDNALLPAPSTYVREDRMQRGDTYQCVLARLGVGDADMRQLLRQRALQQLRQGTIVTAEVRADVAAGKDHQGELVWLGFLTGRDVVLRIERVG